MPSLEIAYPDGRVDRKSLSRTSPLTIGSQSFNDVCVNEDGVGILHCRIGWNKTGFEVTAATPKGVTLNGTLVEHSFLKPRDVLQVGSVDIHYLPDGVESVLRLPEPEPIKPVVEERRRSDKKDKDPPATKVESAGPRRGNKPDVKPKVVADDDLSLFDGPVHAESEAELASPNSHAIDDDFERAAEPAAVVVPQLEVKKSRNRPGEEDVFRSPVVLGLSLGVVVLSLVAATIWFLMTRETSARLFDQANNELADGRYSQAAAVFEEFLTKFPGSSNRRAAEIGLAKALVQKELTGSSPAWNVAWERLQEFVRKFRDSPDYSELRPLVQSYAEQLALGSAKSAEVAKDESLLTVSTSATQLMQRSAGEEMALDGVLKQIREATDRAQSAIERHRKLLATVAAMNAATDAKHPIDALAERERLLRVFPEFRSDRGIEQAVKAAVELEEGTIVAAEHDHPARTEEFLKWPGTSVLPALHARSRTDESSVGRTVWAIAQDSCYGIDTITGEILWRRVIGTGIDLPPVETTGQPRGLLLFDARGRDLVHCRADNGKLIWRTTLPAAPVGVPLVNEGQIYLVCANRQLLRCDLESGTLTSSLTFAQVINGPPAVSTQGEHLFVTGERGLIYALTKRPLACVSVTFTDHAEGSVKAPLLTLGRLLLLAENDRANSARIRLFDASDPARPLPQVAEDRVAGQVLDVPLLRGPSLVVPSEGERLAAFVVNDEPGHNALAAVGAYRVQDGYAGPLHVSLGPDQQFWMSSTAFRRFEVAADSIRMDPNAVAVGITSQPLQAIGEMFFVGRRALFGQGVHFTNIDRDRMVGSWRTVVGARPRIVLGNGDRPVVMLTDSGIVHAIPASRLTSGGVELKSGIDLEIPTTNAEPLLISQLSDGRGCIALRGEAPKVWLVDITGRVAAPLALAQSPVCSPILVDAGLIVPSAGVLSVRPLSGNQKFEDWRAPAGAEESGRWSTLLRTAGDEFLAVETSGHWRRFQIRAGSVSHIAEITSVDLFPPTGVPPLSLGPVVLTATDDLEIAEIDPSSLEVRSRQKLDGAIRGIAAVGTSQALAWTGETLSLHDATKDLATIWTLPLRGLEPLPQVDVQDAELTVACRDGTVLALNRASGEERRRQQVPQQLAVGVIRLPSGVWAVAVDGSLYRLEDSREARP